MVRLASLTQFRDDSFGRSVGNTEILSGGTFCSGLALALNHLIQSYQSPLYKLYFLCFHQKERSFYSLSVSDDHRNFVFVLLSCTSCSPTFEEGHRFMVLFMNTYTYVVIGN